MDVKGPLINDVQYTVIRRIDSALDIRMITRKA